MHDSLAERVEAMERARGGVSLDRLLRRVDPPLAGSRGLQRVNLEQRMAQLSRDRQQAFWHAEAGLDHTLALFNAGATTFAEAAPFPCYTTSQGSAQCTVRTISNTITATEDGPPPTRCAG